MSPIIPIAIAGVVVGGLALALKGKGGKTPDPIDVSPILMQGAAGPRQYTLRKHGPGYAWIIQGDIETSGVHQNSGTAILEMFETLYANNKADHVTGAVAKSTVDGLAGSFSIAEEGRLRWGWIVSKPAPDQASALGSGESTNRGAATIEALRAIEPYTDWIVGLPNVQGGGAPQPDAPDAPGPDGDPVGPQDPNDDPSAFHGLYITDTSVSVFDLPQWTAYASPIITNAIQGHHDGEATLGYLGLNNPVLKFSGKTYESVRAAVQKYLNQWYAENYLELYNVQSTIAAAAVGKGLPTAGKKGLVKNKPVIVRELSPGVWEWMVWEPGNRRGDQFAIFKGTKFDPRPWKAWNAASKAASGPATKGAGGAPIQDCDEGVKSTSLSRNLPSSTFRDSWDKEITLWSPSGDVACRHYYLELGICLRPSGGGSFGALDYYTEDVNQGESPSSGDADEIDFGIDRHPSYGAQMDWWLFKTPLAWKRQYKIELSHLDGKIDILSVQQIEMPAMDPCPEASRRWPGYGDDHYVVQTWGKGQNAQERSPVNWTSQPKMSLAADGKNLVAHIQYQGLPFFKDGGGWVDGVNLFKVLGADPDKKNSYTIAFKIRSVAMDG